MAESIKKSQERGPREENRERFGNVLRNVRAALVEKRDTSVDLLPIASLRADGDSIKNQQIDVINEGERIVVTFKLTKSAWESALEKLRTTSGVSMASITYGGKDFDFRVCSGLKLEIGDLRLYVADRNSNERLASYGLVRIEIGKEKSAVMDEFSKLRDYSKDPFSFGSPKSIINPPVSFDDNPDFWFNKKEFGITEYGIGFGTTSDQDQVPYFCIDESIVGLFNWDEVSKEVGGAKKIPKRSLNHPLVAVYSRSNYRMFYLFADHPKVQELLGMKAHDKVVKVNAKDAEGKTIKIEKGVNYYLLDTDDYSDQSNSYRVLGYQTNKDCTISIVLQNKKTPSDIRVFQFQEFMSRFEPGGVIVKKLTSLDKSPEELADEIDEALDKLLGKSDVLSLPNQETERAYALKRYRWGHNIPSEKVFTSEEEAEIMSKLKRVEVSPGYFTFVEDGRSERLAEKGPFFIFHKITGSNKNLVKIIKSGALLSTHERYRRGLNISGMSSARDMETGGADGVFTRMWSNKDESLYMKGVISSGAVNLIFDPAVVNRTDYYCYNTDQFGSVVASTFKTRLSPEKLLETQRKEGHRMSNEIIFRNGISLKDVMFVVVSGESVRVGLLESLREEEIHEVNGQKIEDFIKVWDGNAMNVMRVLDPRMFEMFKKKAEEQRIKAEKEAREAQIKAEQEAKAAKEKADMEKKIALKAKFPVGSEVMVLKKSKESVTGVQKMVVAAHNDDFTVNLKTEGGSKTVKKSVKLEDLFEKSPEEMEGFKIGDRISEYGAYSLNEKNENKGIIVGFVNKKFGDLALMSVKSGGDKGKIIKLNMDNVTLDISVATNIEKFKVGTIVESSREFHGDNVKKGEKFQIIGPLKLAESGLSLVKVARLEGDHKGEETEFFHGFLRFVV